MVKKNEMKKELKGQLTAAIPDVYEYKPGKSQSIDEATKNLYIDMHHDVIDSLDKIADKYHKSRMGEEELKKYKGIDGILEFFVNTAKKTGHPIYGRIDLKSISKEEKDIVYGTIKNMVKSMAEKGENVEGLFKKFLQDGDTRVFDRIRDAMEQDHTHSYLQGYMGKTLDGMTGDDKKKLAAAHSAYQAHTSHGLIRPNFENVALNLDAVLTQSILGLHKQYQNAKDSGDVYDKLYKKKK